MTIFQDPLYVMSILGLMVILAVYAGKYGFGKKLGAALLVILFTAVIANLGLIPTASNTIPLYDAIFTYLAPLGIFYLLLGVSLKSIKKAGAPMIVLFLIGSFATTVGILIAWYLIDPKSVIGEDAAIIAGMLTGTYTGGSANFNAVALAYNFQEKGILYAGTIAVDNVVSTIWIIITIALPSILRRFWKDKKVKSTNKEVEKEEAKSIDFYSLIWLVFLGIVSYFISEELSKLFPQIPSIITLSTLAILLAQTKFIRNLRGSHELGLYLVYIFLAVIGAYCELSAVIELRTIGLVLLLFALLAVFFHGIIIIVLGSFFYKDWEMIALTSQANIGGGTTAIALAETFGRKELIVPAILVGSLGNALGTYLGFLVVNFL
ncbi:DUF819 domain-containing protein [Eudoraea chungangensis]|uniref:DUF819 family protein n=1 Tax=Eudoraea chungangensis TaxID=1481905 RepID=UPI0023EC35E9|nr:DUF819 family protein [Eudoraea chungangensis]